MKTGISFLIIIIISINLNAQISQSDFEENYNALLETLSVENWKTADSLTTYLLKGISGVESMSYETKVLRYISIYCTAGLLNEKKLTKDEALLKVKIYTGLELITPAHPFDNDCYVNCTHLDSDRKNTMFTGVNNSAGTQIFSFEYVKMKDPIDEKFTKKLKGKMISIKSKLKDISVEGNMFPRFRLECVDGEYRIEDD
jgi:hypothetical protein